jgi:hypothetical protein
VWKASNEVWIVDLQNRLRGEKADKCKVIIKVSRCVREAIDLKNDNTFHSTFIYLFIYLRAFSAAQRPIVKKQKTKEGEEKTHKHKQKMR